MNLNLIDLQTAHVTQLTKEGEGKLPWIVYSEDRRNLAELPGELTESQVFTVMDFAKQYELEAFNIGIEFMKKQKNDEISQIINRGNAQLEELREENQRLANKLEKFIISEE